jgi:hypothetical protein
MLREASRSSHSDKQRTRPTADREWPWARDVDPFGFYFTCHSLSRLTQSTTGDFKRGVPCFGGGRGRRQRPFYATYLDHRGYAARPRKVGPTGLRFTTTIVPMLSHTSFGRANGQGCRVEEGDQTTEHFSWSNWTSGIPSGRRFSRIQAPTEKGREIDCSPGQPANACRETLERLLPDSNVTRERLVHSRK